MELLEGLEVSILNLSEVRHDNENNRIDSEYFQKKFLTFLKNVPNLKPLSYFAKDGYRVVYESTEIVDKDYAIANNFPVFLQATDLQTPFINTDDLFYVDENDWVKYPKGRVKKGEILIEVKGKVEKVAIVPDDFPEKVLISGSVYKLTVNENISKHLLLSYLISSYGVAFKDRYKTNLLISYISKPDLYRIPVPQLSIEFQNKIDELFKIIFKNRKLSEQIYSRAERLLLSAVGLENFTPSAENKNVKSFSESFGASGRLDAEYYLPKYEQMIEFIKNGAHARLGDLVAMRKSIEPGSDVYSSDDSENCTPFLRVSDFNKLDLNVPNVWLTPHFCSDNRDLIDRLQPKAGTILFTKDGSVGTAYLLRDDAEFITSGAVLHLNVKKPKEILPEYLTLVLNSQCVQMQAERDAGGSIILHWRQAEIENVVIPLIDVEKQSAIAALVTESFELRRQSEGLLSAAKKAVETAIEQGEGAALAFLLTVA